jgi:hypothetical protein
MKSVLSWIDGCFCGIPSERMYPPPLHPIDALLYLEWSLSNGKGLAEGLSPWEPRPATDDVPPGLYEPFRAGKLLQNYGGNLESVLELFADAHSSAYRRGSGDELLMLTRRLGTEGFVVSPDGVAVTHPRHLIVLPVPEPVITVCLAHAPVVLGPDGSVPVRVFLSVISPTVGTQLAVLARLSRLIARDRFLQALDGPNPREELMDLAWLHDCGLADEDIVIPKDWTN